MSFIRILFTRLKKVYCQDNLSLLSLQFFKNNYLNILIDNICSHEQVKNQ